MACGIDNSQYALRLPATGYRLPATGGLAFRHWFGANFRAYIHGYAVIAVATAACPSASRLGVPVTWGSVRRPGKALERQYVAGDDDARKVKVRIIRPAPPFRIVKYIIPLIFEHRHAWRGNRRNGGAALASRLRIV